MTSPDSTVLDSTALESTRVERSDAREDVAPATQRPPFAMTEVEAQALCPVEVAARIIGQKWTLQIVKTLLEGRCMRFCELQEALGGVNPTTLTTRLKMLEETGLVRRCQVSDIPPHVEYSLTEMGAQLDDVLDAIIVWSRRWLCPYERDAK